MLLTVHHIDVLVSISTATHIDIWQVAHKRAVRTPPSQPGAMLLAWAGAEN